MTSTFSKVVPVQLGIQESHDHIGIYSRTSVFFFIQSFFSLEFYWSDFSFTSKTFVIFKLFILSEKNWYNIFLAFCEKMQIFFGLTDLFKEKEQNQWIIVCLDLSKFECVFWTVWEYIRVAHLIFFSFSKDDVFKQMDSHKNWQLLSDRDFFHVVECTIK